MRYHLLMLDAITYVLICLATAQLIMYIMIHKAEQSSMRLDIGPL